jgi:hypothetical protein
LVSPDYRSASVRLHLCWKEEVGRAKLMSANAKNDGLICLSLIRRNLLGNRVGRLEFVPASVDEKA